MNANSTGRSGTWRESLLSLADAMKSSNVMPFSKFNPGFWALGVVVEFEPHPIQQIGDLDEVKPSFSYMILPVWALIRKIEE